MLQLIRENFVYIFCIDLSNQLQTNSRRDPKFSIFNGEWEPSKLYWRLKRKCWQELRADCYSISGCMNLALTPSIAGTKSRDLDLQSLPGQAGMNNPAVMGCGNVCSMPFLNFWYFAEEVHLTSARPYRKFSSKFLAFSASFEWNKHRLHSFKFPILSTQAHLLSCLATCRKEETLPL